tara:strand:+ start:2635 stop:2799 length:165 start_codon:yes stop_codon:yes gene_type:complete
MKGNNEVIESGRVAWNELSLIMDEDPELFDSTRDFKEFYFLLCQKLFEDEQRTH